MPPLSAARWTTIAMATLLLAASLMAIVAVQSTYAGRIERTAARTPVLAQASEADIRFAHRLVTVGREQVSMVYVEPLRHDAPPPPGLDRWPSPGSIALSETLKPEAAALAAVHGAVSTWIAPEGLSTPTEKLVYVRPAPTAAVGPDWQYAAGYGEDNRALMAGDVWRVQEPSALMTLVGALVLVPSLVLVVVAAQLDEDRRRRRHTVLATLGAPTHLLIARELRAATRPVLVGVIAGLGVFVLTCVVDLPLPGVAYRLVTADSRREAPSFVAACVVAGVLVLAAVAVLARPRRLVEGTRPRAREPRYPGWLAASAAAIVAVAGFVAVQEAAADSLDAQLWIMIGLVTALALMPFVCGWALRTAGRAVLEAGEARGWPASIVSGAQISASPRSSARLASACAMLIVLVGQVVSLTSMGTADLRGATAEFSRYDGHYLTIRPPDDTAAQDVVVRIHEKLPEGVAVLAAVTKAHMHGGDVDFSTVITGSPEALAAAGLEPGSGSASDVAGPARAVIDPDGTLDVAVGEPTVVAGSEDLVSQQLLVVDPAGDLVTTEVEAVVGAAVAPAWPVLEPGESWRVGAAMEAHQMRWIRWFGVIGAAILMLAAVLRAWQGAHRLGTVSAPLVAITGNNGFPIRRAAVRGGLVSIVAVGAGGAIALHLSGVVDATGNDGGPVRATIAALCLLTVAAVTVATGHEIRAGLTAATRWRPGKDTTA